MKIIKLSVNNFMKLGAVEISPDGRLVQITGRNGAGKTSVLNSLWVALAGKDACPTVPIRRGQERAIIRLDLGEIIVTRTFKRTDSDEYTTSIVVESPDGARFPSPQKMLDALFGALTFDPLAFARMKPRDQFDQLRSFVPGVDFDAIERQNKGDFDRRTEISRFLEQENAAAAAITVPDGTPDELVDEDALVADLVAAGEHNTDVERRRANREQARQTITHSLALADEKAGQIRVVAERLQNERDREVASLKEQIQALEVRIRSVAENCTARIASETERLNREADHARSEAVALEARLTAAGELPEPKDIATLQRAIEEARSRNANVRKLLDRRAHEVRAITLKEKVGALTAAIQQRNADKAAKIAAAQMPVPGISFGDGIVLLNDVPFQQGSDAEQLRASVAIAMALSPTLRVLRIRDGSLLDEQSLALLAQIAQEKDFQCWIEMVDSSGKVGFVLEDGAVVHRPQQEEAATCAPTRSSAAAAATLESAT